MKTAEEWLHVDNFPSTLDPTYANENFAHWVERIQLNALQEAARVAKAQYADQNWRGEYRIAAERISDAILSLANTLTNGGEGK